MAPRSLRALGRPLALPLAIIASASLLNGCAPSSGGRVVARVDGETIGEADLVHAAQSVPAYTLDPSPDGKRALLDEVVNRTLIVAEARRQGLDKAPELKQIEHRAEEEVLPQLLYDRLIGGRVRVTEDEARSLWELQGEEWRVSQIFTFSESEAAAAAQKLRRGMPFGQVAMSLSKDRDTGVSGGDLGYVTAGLVPREMEAALRGLKKGQWTGPIKTPLGWYLVQVTDRRPRQRPEFEAVRQQLTGILRQRKERSLVLEYVARLKQRRHLRANPEAYSLLAAKWQNRTTAELLQSRGDPAGLGFTPAELALPIENWDGGSYTIQDFFREMQERSGLERPSMTDDVALRLYVGDRAVNRMILDEARAMGLDDEPETKLRLRDREEAFLINRFYERFIVPSSQPTPAEMEQLRAQFGSLSGDPAAAEKLAQAQQTLFVQKSQRALNEFITRLRREHPPKIDERALAAVPWPVAPKESS